MAADDGKENDDYHTSINGERWCEYLRNRIIPTFEAKYPGKKMYLVLDNAAYHHHRGPDWISPYKLKKPQLAEVLRQRGVASISSPTKGNVNRIIPSTKFSADISAGGPTLAQLQTAVKLLLAEHPEINTTVTQQLMSDKKHVLVYTPPWVPDVQPIELIWSQVKQSVARQFSFDRNIEKTRIQTEDAMGKIKSQAAKKVIRSCHKWIDNFLADSDRSLSLHQFGTLQQLIDSPIAAAIIA